MDVFLAGVRRTSQPSPARNPGGDCFACALKSALDFLVPEHGRSAEEVWHIFDAETVGGGVATNNTWPGMQEALDTARFEWELPIDWRIDLPLPLPDLENFSYCFGNMFNWEDYFYRLDAWLRAGYLALVEMRIPFSATGGLSADGKKLPNNHFALIDGVRRFWEPIGDIGRKLTHEVHFVDSSKHNVEWVPIDDAIVHFGIGALLLVRRDEVKN